MYLRQLAYLKYQTSIILRYVAVRKLRNSTQCLKKPDRYDLYDKFINSQILLIIKRLTLVKEALTEIGCVVTSLVGCHARALWPNGAS